MMSFWTRVVRGDATKEQAKDTGMALVLILLLVRVIARRDGYLVAAVAAQVANMVAPQLFRPVAVIWFAFSQLLGEVMSRVVLSVIFFVVITPIGLVRRMMGADTMKLKAFKGGHDSVMVTRDHTYVARDMEMPY